MKRLTPKDLHPYKVKNFVDKFNDKGDDPCFRSKVIDKLWEYENAEEQGLIVKLPVKIGEIVYSVTEVTGTIRRFKIYPVKLTRQMIGYLGHTYFGTKEEAQELICKYLNGKRNYDVDSSW